MTIKIVLIALFSLIGLVAISQLRAARILSGTLIVLCGLAIISILYQDLANTIAHAVGVGRGADLVLYLFIPAALLMQLLQYLSYKSLERSITDLSRHLALATVRAPRDS